MPAESKKLKWQYCPLPIGIGGDRFVGPFRIVLIVVEVYPSPDEEPCYEHTKTNIENKSSLDLTGPVLSFIDFNSSYRIIEFPRYLHFRIASVRTKNVHELVVGYWMEKRQIRTYSTIMVGCCAYCTMRGVGENSIAKVTRGGIFSSQLVAGRSARHRCPVEKVE